MLKWFTRALIGLVAVVALLLVAGYAYEAVSAWNDARRFDPPGAMVDVGGYRLNINCIGDALGPTVVIEAGGGVGVVGYIAVQEQIAQFAHVCSYDRAGLGWSEPAPTPRTFDVMARELNVLLERSGVPGPYVLAAHSFGGGIARVFARDYRDKTAGLALIETGDEPLAFNPAAQEGFARAKEINTVANVLHRFGVVRLVPPLLGPYAEAAPEIKARILRPGIFRAMAREGDAYAAIPEEQRRPGGFGTLGDLPVVVVVRGRPDMGGDAAFEQEWREAHRRLSQLSSNSVLIVAEGSGHTVHLEEPDVYVNAVRRVVVAARENSRLVETE
jgi:pimeloyl-ACP methyl ester carboxylesterase